MRVVVLEHASGEELVCRDAEDAADSLTRCLEGQAHKARSEREEIKVRYEYMTKAEYEALPETDRC